MILNKNSWHVKLANFFDSDPTEEQNFCKYFWLTIIRLIFFLPVWVIGFPCDVLRIPFNDWKERVIVGFVTTALLFTIFLLFPILEGNWLFVFMGPSIILIGLGFLGINVYLDNKWKQWRSSKNNNSAYKEPKPNFFVEGFKAFYGKYCPKIDWK